MKVCYIAAHYWSEALESVTERGWSCLENKVFSLCIFGVYWQSHTWEVATDRATVLKTGICLKHLRSVMSRSTWLVTWHPGSGPARDPWPDTAFLILFVYWEGYSWYSTGIASFLNSKSLDKGYSPWTTKKLVPKNYTYCNRRQVCTLKESQRCTSHFLNFEIFVIFCINPLTQHEPEELLQSLLLKKMSSDIWPQWKIDFGLLYFENCNSIQKYGL